MSADTMRSDLILAAILAGSKYLEREIVIQTDADFSPAGKRRWAVVSHTKKGQKCGKRIMWYVGRRAYRSLPYSEDNVVLSKRWESAQARAWAPAHITGASTAPRARRMGVRG